MNNSVLPFSDDMDERIQQVLQREEFNSASVFIEGRINRITAKLLDLSHSTPMKGQRLVFNETHRDGSV